jgi:predicted N-formylglutamate amidohydrolase
MPRPRAALRPIELVISCEHAGNRIPARYRKLFSYRLLSSHRGYDPGALTVARDFARAFRAPLFYSTVSRLLVELNRSPGHRQSFSARVPARLRAELMKRYYWPYRERVESHIGAAVRRGRRVVHLSCHSFTPRLAGVWRRTDVGLLFDPRRAPERTLCTAWQTQLRRLVVRKNYPYRGSDDGLTTYLRTRFAERDYVGIELEVNQKFPRAGGARWLKLRRTLVTAFAEALDSGRGSPCRARRPPPDCAASLRGT